MSPTVIYWKLAVVTSGGGVDARDLRSGGKSYLDGSGDKKEQGHPALPRFLSLGVISTSPMF